MKKSRDLIAGGAMLAAFALWTVLIRTADVRAVGPEGTKVGLAGCNLWFHRLTGVHLGLYTVTDWLGLVPIAVGLAFAALGALQWIRRGRLLSVDPDILLLGIYYLAVLFFYLFFEAVPLNYRPILLNGALEASYPSSTTLLVLSVMPTLTFQLRRRRSGPLVKRAAGPLASSFSALMVMGRAASGVHWASDIVGALLLSGGLFRLYRYCVSLTDRHRENNHGIS